MPVYFTVKAARERATLSQYQLADLAGVRRATIADMERRTTPVERVDVVTLEKLARAMRLKSPLDLLKYVRE